MRLGGYGGYFREKRGVTVTVLSQIELPDTWMTPHESYGDMFFFCCCFFDVGVLGYHRRPVDEILTQKWLHQLNVTRDSIEIGVSSKWDKFQVCVIYPFIDGR